MKGKVEVHLSHSQINEFLRCPRKYHLHRRLGLEPEFCPSALLFGSAIHRALALYHQRRLEGRLASLAELMSEFRECVDGEALPVRYRKGQDAKGLKQKARGMLEHYLANTQPAGDVLAVEEGFRLRLFEQLPAIYGRIDLVEQTEDEHLVVTDFKTAKSRRTPDPDQLVLYREAVSKLDYPGKEVRIRYVVLLKTAEPDIAVYEPKLQPDALDSLAALYQEVWRAIQSGSSYPRTGWWCNGCQWARYCDRV